MDYRNIGDLYGRRSKPCPSSSRRRPGMEHPLRARGRGGAPYVISTLAVCLLMVVAACSSNPTSSPSATGTATGRSAAASTMLPSAIKSAGVLKILTIPEFQPITYYQSGSPGSSIVGSDPDIMRAIASTLGIKPQFIPIPSFPGILSGIQSGRGDVAAAGLTDTTQREAAFTFIDELRIGELYLVRKADAARLGISENPMSACGHTIAYALGTVSTVEVPKLSAQCAAAGKPAIKAIPVSGVNETALAVLSGRADTTMWEDIGFAQLNQANHGALMAYKLSSYPSEYWGFAVSKGNCQLAAALNTALGKVVASSEYMAILKRYGLTDDAIRSPGIDLQGNPHQTPGRDCAG